MIACGPSLVRILYDSRYWEAGWILQFLSVAAWFQILESTNGAALLAMGHTHWKAAIGAVKVATLVAFVTLGFHLGGFRGALIGLVGSDLAKYTVSMIGVSAHGLRATRFDIGPHRAGCGRGSGRLRCRHAVTSTPSRSILPFAAAAPSCCWSGARSGSWYLRHRRATASQDV